MNAVLHAIGAIACWACVAVAPPALAALAPVPEAQMLTKATVAVVGTVRHIAATADRSQPGRVVTHYVADLTVERVLKGAGLAPGDRIQVVYWHRTWLPGTVPMIGNDGHHVLPREGESVTVYLNGRVGGPLSVLMPSGFVR